MTDAGKGSSEGGVKQKKSNWSDLAARTVSGVTLAVFAFAVTYWGGLAFAAFFGLVALLVYREWISMVGEEAKGIPAIVGLCIDRCNACLLLRGSMAGSIDHSSCRGRVSSDCQMLLLTRAVVCIWLALCIGLRVCHPYAAAR